MGFFPKYSTARFFSRFVVKLSRVGHAAGTLLLFGAVILLVTEIVARRFLGTTTSLTEEYAGYFCAGLIFLGAAQTFASGHHIRSDLLINHLSSRIRRGVELGVHLSTFLVSIFLLLGMAAQWFDAWNFQARSFYPSRTPLWIPLAIPVVGLVLLTLQVLAKMLGDSNE